MLLADLCLGEMEIMIHHFEGGVAQYFSKTKNISAVEQIVNSEGMTAQMSVKTGYAGLLGQSGEHQLEGISSHGITVFG